MRRYTTPTHELTIKGTHLEGCDVYVTYKQGKKIRTIEVEPVISGDDTKLTIPFSQLETAEFRVGQVEVQVNWVYPDGTRDATNIANADITQGTNYRKGTL